jgi:hypothetical protein
MILKTILSLSILLTGCLKKEKEVIEAPPPLVFDRPSGDPPPVSPSRPGFVDLDNAEDTMLIDAQTLGSRDERLRTRYLIACDRYNSDVNLTDVESGGNKLINSLSRERFISKVTPIGNANCIYRIDLDDYGITYLQSQLGGPDDPVHGSIPEWRKIENAALLDFVSDTIRNQNLQFLLQTRKPYLFLLDFAVTTMEGDAIADQNCELYCDLVEQPIALARFYEARGLNLQVAADTEELLMAGFSRSQIALGKTRLVQIAEIDDGWCATSYDTSLAQQDSIFENPFTVEVAQAGGILQTDKIFGLVNNVRLTSVNEHLCTLPNGMYEHRLNGEDGIAATAAPNDVVVNTNHPRLDPTVRLADCFSCHHQMAQGFRDEVREAVLNNGSFNSDEKNLAEIFYNDTALQAVLGQINARYNQALREVGVTQSTDPVNSALIERFREEVDILKAASWTFLDVREFREKLEGSAISSQVLQNLLNGGTVSIGTFVDNYTTLVEELNLFEDNDL